MLGVGFDGIGFGILFEVGFGCLSMGNKGIKWI